ncbi:MAG: hypothetical protein IKY92_05560 [Akkermansia sp.]|nr:hypothetical protein [Akkermansia sp.]
MDAETGDAAGLDGVTFAGAVHCDGLDFDVELTLSEADASRNTVLVSIPPLPEGRWEYEVWLAADTGEKVRLLEGRISALGKLAAVDRSVYAHRTLNVLLPGDVNKRVQLEWQASTVAVQAMNEALRVAEGVKDIGKDAKDALESAKEALDKLDGVDDLVDDAEAAKDGAETAKEGAEAVLESAKELIANAPREFIPTISADGYWVLNGVKQPHKAIGEDGLDGDRIVKHLVNSVEEIPTSGETCNSGHVYYVNVPAVLNVLEEKPAGTGEWTAWRLPADMVPHGVLLSGLVVPAIRNTSSTALWLAVYLREGGTNRALLTRSKEPKTWTNGADVAWEFAAPIEVPAGAGLELAWAESLEAIGATSAERPAQRLKSAVLEQGGAFLRYDAAWYGDRTPFLGFTSPHAGKVLVYEWFDETGWVCLAGNGAQASRPATATEDGTVKLGTEAPVAQGAPVGVNANNQMMVPQATTLCSGTVMYSTDEVIEGGIPIGRDAAGRMVALGTNVAPAQAFRWGTVKVGTSVPQSMGMPWIIPVGIASNGVRNEYGQDITGQLFNNTVPGGALRTMMKADWVAKGISGWNVGTLPNGSNAVGVMAKKEQFDQTPDDGLVLKKATRDTVAGVRLTNNPLDEVEAHVLDAATLHQFYHTRGEIETLLRGYIRTNTTLFDIKVMTQEAYDALEVIEAHTLYLVY